MAKLKLTEKLIQEVYKYLKEGNTQKTSALCAGITERTFYDWLDKAADASRKENPDKKDELYIQFSQYVKKGVEEAKLRNLRIIQSVAQGSVTKTKEYKDEDGNTVTEKEYTQPNWHAAAWTLERRWPKEFGRKDKVDVNQKSKVEHSYGNIKEVFDALPEEEQLSVIKGIKEEQEEKDNTQH